MNELYSWLSGEVNPKFLGLGSYHLKLALEPLSCEVIK